MIFSKTLWMLRSTISNNKLFSQSNKNRRCLQDAMRSDQSYSISIQYVSTILNLRDQLNCLFAFVHLHRLMMNDPARDYVVLQGERHRSVYRVNVLRNNRFPSELPDIANGTPRNWPLDVWLWGGLSAYSQIELCNR